MELLLSVKRGKFRSDDPSLEMNTKEFKAIRPTILDRDDHKCRFCDFRALKYQEVHHADDDHSNNSEDNLITVCPLCHACFHIGLTGLKSRGRLIYLKTNVHITQPMLNNFVRILWVASESNDPSLVSLSSNLLKRLEKSHINAKRHLGTSDPAVIANSLLNDDDLYDNGRENLFKNVFLLPEKEGFLQAFQYWKKETFKTIPLNQWVSIAENKAPSLGLI
ncbi:type IVB secretion system protein IcmJDotN [Neptuniibacter sp. QD37_11]|uniref:type IVB secretion system protein IcmJDotN n=1 Tax=Neptuniibacter sp. QD37_11 TaxID=3398209 RepID=UPI0039F62EDF